MLSLTNLALPELAHPLRLVAVLVVDNGDVVLILKLIAVPIMPTAALMDTLAIFLKVNVSKELELPLFTDSQSMSLSNLALPELAHPPKLVAALVADNGDVVLILKLIAVPIMLTAALMDTLAIFLKVNVSKE